MMFELIETLLFATVRSATPLVIAGLGILILEKSGVLNLGQEGVISLGAVTGFIIALKTNSFLLAILVSALSGVALVMVFAFVVLKCKANQVISGLALGILGAGLAIFVSAPFIGESLVGISPTIIPILSNLPVIGKALFSQDIFVYLTCVLAYLTYFLLYKTRWGMILRAVGEHPHAAHALGYYPNRVRLVALAISGALVAVAGAYLSLVYTPILSEGLSAGRGWIALALVVFASRLIGRLILGACIFGFTSIMHLVLQGLGVSVSGSLLAMMPYTMTILSLVLISVSDTKNSSKAEPNALGTNFTASH